MVDPSGLPVGQALTYAKVCLSRSCLPLSADSRMLLTACDDMHSHLYDVEHASLVEAFSGQPHACIACQ